jgi:hypothetical protein
LKAGDEGGDGEGKSVEEDREAEGMHGGLFLTEVSKGI